MLSPLISQQIYYRQGKTVKLVAIDFETANRNPNSACALGIVQIENNTIVHEEIFLIRPPSYQFEFTRIHGIIWADVAQAPTFKQVWTQISTRIETADALVAHNASFDRRVLYACCDLYQIPQPKQRFICTVALARERWNLYPTKLPDVCNYLNINLNHHQALSDARACAEIAIAAAV
ncbi:3'-5' exonuclease [Chamaesiphon sp. OTE_75_metabat_556]|uniref:3'-5' exonuclease n=1 Tax=Chamaesiphon sp. OTE_75_metabat_556 TaxID=2964692 RepID=UPI00286B72EA|nr:3'-5' exonuclease [Chamaesiphon sp. OTE_75_metabat_556]